jgi:predicted MarR family transcription regulator
LRFGDPRVMALAGALSVLLNRTVGFTHRSLRARVAALLGSAYTANQMSYDLTRLRRKGLIQRLPRSNTYTLTSDGIRFALFYTKVHDRLLVPLLAADRPPASPQLRAALQVVDQSVHDYVRQARLEAA